MSVCAKFQLTTGCFKKNALIENRFKDTKYEAKLHWKSRFSSSDHNYDMENTCLNWPGCSLCVSWVFSGYFVGFQEYLKIISRVF